MKPVRLGVIGVGYIFRRAHMPALQRLRDAGLLSFAAFCDVDADMLAESAADCGVARTFSDHRAMLDSVELDAVAIFIPPTRHTDAELLTAERGVHLLIEKPVTLRMAQARLFSEAIARAGVVSQVGFMSRYYPAAERMRAMLAERTPRHALVQRLYSGAPIRLWTSKMDLCGGSFVENSIHMVDLLRYLLGDIEAVSAFYVERKPSEMGGMMDLPHAYLVNYRFSSGVAAQFAVSRVLTNVKASRVDVTLVADDSLLEWSSQRIVENGATVWQAEEAAESPFYLQDAAFIRAAAAGDSSAVRSPYGEALNSLAAVLAANASAARGGELVDVLKFQREEED